MSTLSDIFSPGDADNAQSGMADAPTDGAVYDAGDAQIAPPLEDIPSVEFGEDAPDAENPMVYDEDDDGPAPAVLMPGGEMDPAA